MSSIESGVLVASSEFVLKSSPVRRAIEQRLSDDLRISLKTSGFNGFRIEKRSARFLVRGLSDVHEAASILSKVFGVAYAAPVDIVPLTLESVLQSIQKLASESLGYGESFAIRAKHSQANLSNKQIEIRGGAEIQSRLRDRRVTVDLEHPDVLISVDIADDLVFVYRNKIQGPGGLPLSSQWKLLALLDSGPLSILAAYSLMRRGCLVELFIPISRKVNKFAEEVQLGFAEKLRALVTRPQYKAYVVDLDKVLNEARISEQLLSMAARKLAEFFASKNKFRGIVLPNISGEISQFQENHQLPVFYPLIGLEFEDLLTMCDLAGILRQQLRTYLASESQESKIAVEGLDRNRFAVDFSVSTVALNFPA